VDIKQMEHLIVVAEEGNIGRAAIRINISQPPLTRQIQQVEQELGYPLFIRTPKGVELTEVGVSFIEDARNIIELREQMIDRAKRFGQGSQGRLDVGAFGSTALTTVPKILAHFREEQPEVKVVLHTMNKRSLLGALRSKRIHVGFNPFIQPEPGFSIKPVCKSPIIVALRENHPLAQLEAIPPVLLAHEPLILVSSGERMNFLDLVLDVFKNVGVKPQVAQELDEPMACLSLIASGFGYGLVAETAIELSFKGVAYRRLDTQTPPMIDLSCIYLEDNENPLLQTFLSSVRGFSQAHND
jgi:LysR family transcriptional regulator, benzoate and cis,cis-muconate-responsive activator of ben and cat genes